MVAKHREARWQASLPETRWAGWGRVACVRFFCIAGQRQLERGESDVLFGFPSRVRRLGLQRGKSDSGRRAARHSRLGLEIFWFQARVLGNAGKHLGPDFFGVAESPSEFAPCRVGKLD